MSLRPDGCYSVRRVSEVYVDRRVYVTVEWVVAPKTQPGDVYETKPDGTFYTCVSANIFGAASLMWAGPFPTQTAAEVAWELLK